MKLIIAGSRTFNDYDFLETKMDYLLKNIPHDEEITIVSGTARGADSLGKRYAQERDYNIKEFPANWDKFGKGAGHIRNREMAEYATHCVVFWNGKSRGSNHMIELCEEYDLEYRVYSIIN